MEEKKQKYKRKDSFDYIRRIFVNMFHNTKSKYSILRNTLVWRTTLHARIRLIRMIKNFGSF